YLGHAGYGSLLSIGVGPTLAYSMTVGDGSWVRAIAVDAGSGRVYVATDHALTILEEHLPYRIYLPLLPKIPPSPNPPGMEAPEMVYDTEREVLVLYDGGSWKFGWPLWEYDGSSWRPLHPAHMPFLVRKARMAYDQARRRIVAGGMVGDYYESETWEYDGNDWYRVLFWYPGYAAARMVYDQARERVLLFGGFVGGRGWSGYSNRTWEYDGSNWIQVHTTYTPTCRAHLGLAYDSDRQVTVLFGGYGGPPCTPDVQTFSDTWEYDAQGWHLITPTHSPQARDGHAMVYDSRRKVTVLFGGWGRGGVYLNDTWEYDGSDWHLVTPTLSPSPRADPAMAYDAARGVVVLFGGHGSDAGVHYADTWVYDGTTWRQIAGPVDAGSERRW
ncbi:MAG: Kelch repeat-containing protein, partial [Anaerolineae bacterium]